MAVQTFKKSKKIEAIAKAKITILTSYFLFFKR